LKLWHVCACRVHLCIYHSMICTEWVLWEHKAAAASGGSGGGGGGNKNPNQWKDNMSALCTFSTVEEFWRNFNHIPKPSEIFYDGDCRKKIGPEQKTVEEFSLFKKGIEPEWGDPENVVGGEWYCRQYFEPDVLDLYWQNLVLGVVGESIEDGVEPGKDHINGVRVVDKSRGYFPMYRLEIWINTRDEAIRDRIRTRLLDIMTDGQMASRKTHPKFDWKDHSA
jgi:translation initiation factor 4E